MTSVDDVRRHYTGPESEKTLVESITATLDELHEGELATASDRGFDHFHIRGMAATLELAQLAGIDARMRVLDAGSGFGGPARFLAKTFGAHVTGVDLTPDFVAVSQLIAERLGLRDLVTYDVGDLAHLDYRDASFDLVWTQHVVMNVPDRDRVYREFRRVLGPGGRLAFYDVVASDDEHARPYYPVPWAETSATSFLLKKAETIASMERAGFALTEWIDVTERAVAWFGQAPAAISQGLSLATLLGPRVGPMTQNFARNLGEGRLHVAMGLCRTT